MPITRMQKGTKKRRRKRQRGSMIAATLIGSCIALLFFVWVFVSFQALILESQSAVSSSHNVIGPGHNVANIVRQIENAFVPGNNAGNKVQKMEGGALQSGIQPYQSPLLIFTCSRANYLTETLDNIYSSIPTTCVMGCPIVVSQDKDIPEVTKVIESFKAKFEAKGIPFYHLVHPTTTNLRGNAYNLLAVHYGWALRTLFDGKAYDKYSLPDRVIILEEDLRIAPDFFDYFEATAPLLDSDPKLLAVSAFNDNGYSSQVSDAKRLLRSDFFPGLGWMMTRNTWVNDLGSKWPTGYWDDWLREPQQRQNRQFIRPEITRTFHFGAKGGASGNQFGGNLNRVMLNTAPIEWKSEDLSYLEPEKFDNDYAHQVASAKLVHSRNEALEQVNSGNNARIEYKGIDGFRNVARQFNLMTDEKAGIFRTAYKGVVETRPNGGNFVYLTPPFEELKASFGDKWPNQ